MCGTRPKDKTKTEIITNITFFNFIGAIGFGGDNGCFCIFPLNIVATFGVTILVVFRVYFFFFFN